MSKSSARRQPSGTARKPPAAKPAATKAPGPKRSRKKLILWTLGGLVALFLLIQLIPYGRNATNPPANSPFQWSSTAVEDIARRSCYDCHSNETKRWWAVKIAPFSWLAQHDVSKGRSIFNFSDWNGTLSPELLQHAVTDNMPPIQYTLLHPSAKLTDAEKQQLVQGFQDSLAYNGGSTPAASSTPSSSTGSTSDATAVINARCGQCHSAQPALAYHASSASEAQSLLDAMVQQGASLTPAEEQTLIKYYTR